MLKYKRNYQAVFYITDKRTDKEEVVIIEPPFTVSFKCNVGYSNGSTGCFQFLNLDYDVQKKLWKDYYDLGYKEIRIQFFAGYGETEELSLIADFDVLRCTSERQSGSVDMTTTVQCMDGSNAYGQLSYANITFDKNSKYVDIISNLIDKVPNLKVGYIADDLGELPNSRTFIGNCIDLIENEFKNHYVYIANNELNVLNKNQYIFTEIPVISEESGMLGTPRIEDTFMLVDTMFEPKLKVLQLIYLQSSYRLIQPQLYKIYDITHSGVISNTYASNLTTTLTLELFRVDEKKEKNIAKKPLQQKEEERQKQQATTSYNWIRPVEGKVTSQYGKRIAPLKGASTDHKGIDISANAGTSVKSVTNGTVVSAGYDQWNGNVVRINHGNGIVSIYAHLQNYIVNAGQKINKGDIIGFVGSTGLSTAPHLHFGVKVNDIYVNPNKYVRY